VHAELQEIAGILLERSSLEPLSLAGAPHHWALTLHGRYTRAEILSAVGYLTPIARPLSDSGCLPLTEEKIELRKYKVTDIKYIKRLTRQQAKLVANILESGNSTAESTE
jgi:hypothetical protein